MKIFQYIREMTKDYFYPLILLYKIIKFLCSRKNLKNLYLGIKDQGPLKRFFKNFFITGNARGLFVINSHLSSVSGKEKIKYNSKETAIS